MNPFNIKNQNNRQNGIDFSSIQNNPMFQMLRGKGMSYEQIVKYMCQQKNIDFNQLMNQARKMMGNNK